MIIIKLKYLGIKLLSYYIYFIMINKSNIFQNLIPVQIDDNNPEEKRRKELNGLMKRFGELLDPSGY